MSEPPGDIGGTVRAPSIGRRLLELLSPLELASFVAAAPAMLLPCGSDRHPVLVLPGFTAGDASTVPLRWAIRGQGYSTHAWRLGRNIGPTRPIVDGMRTRLDDLAERHQRTVSIVGWSLGGTYARLLARERPELVRQVISLGSPYRMIEGDKSTAHALWKRYEHLYDRDVDLDRTAEQDRPRLTVPATSIYTRRDGIAPWQTCIDEVGPIAENIEVHGSHSALGVNPAVMFAVLDRLRVAEGDWRPFRAPIAFRPWYPQPASWRGACQPPRSARQPVSALERPGLS